MRKITLSLLILLVLPALAGAQSFVRWIPPPNVISLYETSTNVVLTKPFSLPDGSATAPSLGNGTSGFRFDSGGIYAIRSGVEGLYITRSGTQSAIRLCVTGTAGCGSYTSISANPTALSILPVGNVTELVSGTSAQTLNVYNTYTDGSNYERASIYWSSGSFYIEGQAAGSGSSYKTLYIGDATDTLYLGGATGIIAAAANSLSPATGDVATLGQTSASRYWQSLYVTRSFQGSKSKTLTDASATGFVQIALPQTVGSNFTSGTILWQVHCDNGTATTYADRAGQTVFTCNNISGTEACVFDSTAQQVTQAATYSLAAPSWTATGGTDAVVLNVNADCAGVAGPTNMYIHYRLDILDPQTVTPQ